MMSGNVAELTRVGLHVDPPLVRAEPVRLQRSLLSQKFNFVYKFISTIVSLVGHALGVLVVQTGGEALQHGQGGEVLGRNHLEAGALPGLLRADEPKQLRVRLPQVACHVAVHS